MKRTESVALDEQILQTFDDLRQRRREMFADLLSLPDDWMGRVGSFQGKPISVQWMALRYADHDEEHAIQLADNLMHHPEWRQNKVHQLLSVNEVTQGELLAALEGLTDDDLDTIPVDPEGEWSLRQTLSHIVFVEHAYRLDILHAIEMSDAGEPVVELLDLDLPHLYPDDSLSELIGRIDAERDRTIRELSAVDERYLSAQSRWDNLDVDVNFLFMRLGHHIREHQAHIWKWRVQTGKHPTEMARLLGLSWIHHGRIRGQLIGASADVFNTHPIEGEWSPAEILEHLRFADSLFRDRIKGTVTWAEWEAKA